MNARRVDMINRLREMVLDMDSPPARREKAATQLWEFGVQDDYVREALPQHHYERTRPATFAGRLIDSLLNGVLITILAAGWDLLLRWWLALTMPLTSVPAFTWESVVSLVDATVAYFVVFLVSLPARNYRDRHLLRMAASMTLIALMVYFRWYGRQKVQGDESAAS